MLRWGVLSTAKIAREQLIPAHQQAQNGTVSAVASRSLEKAQACAERFGIPKAHGSYEDLLADPDIDAVIIPLPTSQHVEWSIRAADAGKHVLCEKPIALHADEIGALKEAADRNGVIISEAFMVTHHPQWHMVRDLLATGAIGDLQHVQGAFTYHNLDADNMRNQKALGGGGLPDIGVYPTVTTRFATQKEPDRVHATVRFDPKFQTDYYSSVKADFGDFELSFYCGTQMGLRQFMAFHGSAGLIQLESPFNPGTYDFGRLTLFNQNRTEARQFTFPGINQYVLQAENFARAALSGAPDDRARLFSLDDSIRNQKVIDAIYRAGQSENWEAV